MADGVCPSPHVCTANESNVLSNIISIYNPFHGKVSTCKFVIHACPTQAIIICICERKFLSMKISILCLLCVFKVNLMFCVWIFVKIGKIEIMFIPMCSSRVKRETG